MTALAQRDDFRALQLYEHIPAGHIGVIVTDDRFAPHLKIGEVAVVDITDRGHQRGEIFAVRHDHPIDGPYLRLVQAHSRDCQNQHGPYLGLFWTYGIRRSDGLVMSDGPVRQEGWLRYSIGRVVVYLAARWEG